MEDTSKHWEYSKRNTPLDETLNVKNPEVYEAGNCYAWWRWLSATEYATAAEGLWSFGFAIFFTVRDCECDLWMWFVSERRICTCWGSILQCVMIAEFYDVGESAVAAAELWLPGFAICFDVRSLWIWLSPEEPCCGQSLQSNYDICHDKRSCNWLLMAWSTLSSQCSSSL